MYCMFCARVRIGNLCAVISRYAMARASELCWIVCCVCAVSDCRMVRVMCVCYWVFCVESLNIFMCDETWWGCVQYKWFRRHDGTHNHTIRKRERMHSTKCQQNRRTLHFRVIELTRNRMHLNANQRIRFAVVWNVSACLLDPVPCVMSAGLCVTRRCRAIAIIDVLRFVCFVVPSFIVCIECSAIQEIDIVIGWQQQYCCSKSPQSRCSRKEHRFGRSL